MTPKFYFWIVYFKKKNLVFIVGQSGSGKVRKYSAIYRRTANRYKILKYLKNHLIFVNISSILQWNAPSSRHSPSPFITFLINASAEKRHLRIDTPFEGKLHLLQIYWYVVNVVIVCSLCYFLCYFLLQWMDFFIYITSFWNLQLRHKRSVGWVDVTLIGFIQLIWEFALASCGLAFNILFIVKKR